MQGHHDAAHHAVPSRNASERGGQRPARDVRSTRLLWRSTARRRACLLQTAVVPAEKRQQKRKTTGEVQVGSESALPVPKKKSKKDVEPREGDAVPDQLALGQLLTQWIEERPCLPVHEILKNISDWFNRFMRVDKSADNEDFEQQLALHMQTVDDFVMPALNNVFKYVYDSEQVYVRFSDGHHYRFKEGAAANFQKLKFAQYKFNGFQIAQTWFFHSLKETYETSGFYPPGMECPRSHFNIWRGFAIEQHPRIEPTAKMLKDKRRLFRQLWASCGGKNGDPKLRGLYFLILCIAWIIQYPGQMTNVFVNFWGVGGTGKSTPLELIKALIGIALAMVSTKPALHLFADQNEHLFGLLAFCIDEGDGTVMRENQELFKTMITNPILPIRGMHKKLEREVPNTLSYFGACNSLTRQDPDERRIQIFGTCSTFLRNTAHFNALYASFKDPDFLRMMFDFFKSVPLPNGLRLQDVRATDIEAMREMKALNISAEAEFLMHYYFGETPGPWAVRATDLYNAFKQWFETKNEGMRAQSQTAFGTKLRMLEVTGLTKDPGSTVKYMANLAEMKKWFQAKGFMHDETLYTKEALEVKLFDRAPKWMKEIFAIATSDPEPEDQPMMFEEQEEDEPEEEEPEEDEEHEEETEEEIEDMDA